MKRISRVVLSVVSVLAPVAIGCVVACGSSDDDDDAARDGGALDGGADGSRETAVSDVVYESRVDDAGNAVPIPGARVCLPQDPDVACVVSDETGTFTIDVPSLPADGARVNIALAATAPGHLGAVQLDTDSVGLQESSSFDLMTDALATTWASQAGFTYPGNGTSYIGLRLPAGAVATLSPASGVGPVYTDEMGIPTPSLTAAVGAVGGAYFGNVAPGPFTLTVTLAGKPCSVGSFGVDGDWLGPTASSISGETVANLITDGLTMICD